MNGYLRDRNENSRSIFNFAHFTSRYGLCQKSYLRTCQRKRGTQKFSSEMNVLDMKNLKFLFSVCMVYIDSVNVSSFDRFWLVYNNYISSLTVSSIVSNIFQQKLTLPATFLRSFLNSSIGIVKCTILGHSIHIFWLCRV